MKKVLIAGATGLVGHHLISILKREGFDISILSTRKNVSIEGVSSFYWNPALFEMDAKALEGIDSIINLAGATLNKRWTTKYKQEIVDSRVRTARTIFNEVSKLDSHNIKSYISASAVGFYPSSISGVYTEEHDVGNSFLAQVCQQWEEAANGFSALEIRTTIFRIGIVLDANGGVLKELHPLAKFGLASPLGSGQHWMSWIHPYDLCKAILHAVQNQKMVGAFNAVAPNPVQKKEFTSALCQVLRRPQILPAVPSIILKVILGQMAEIALDSQNASSEKLKSTGFNFEFEYLSEALKDIFSQR